MWGFFITSNPNSHLFQHEFGITVNSQNVSEKYMHNMFTTVLCMHACYFKDNIGNELRIHNEIIPNLTY